MIRSIVIGITIGAIMGYAYYYFIGCNTGSCPITSKPLHSVLYGAALGALLVLNSKKTNKKDDTND